MALDKMIAFLGGGNMGEVLIKGLIAAGTTRPDHILASDISMERLEDLKKRYGITIKKTNFMAAQEADIIVLSVKPQVIESVLSEISSIVSEKKLVISIAAGIGLTKIEKGLKDGARVVRVMPNTPALVLAGAAVLAAGKNATSDDLVLAQHIFKSVGSAVIIEEKLLDAVTGISGCGPAYMFVILDAMSDAGVKIGLPRQLALELAAQTMYGAAKMLLETKEHPGKLRDMVTSPGGSTIAGLHALEKGKLRATMIDAVEAAVARSRELGK
jgi:pyrroline-5-carboxylate reductase